MAITSLAVRGGLPWQAIHVAGADNPAGAPSRGQVALSERDFTFMHFHEFAIGGTSHYDKADFLKYSQIISIMPSFGKSLVLV